MKIVNSHSLILLVISSNIQLSKCFIFSFVSLWKLLTLQVSTDFFFPSYNYLQMCLFFPSYHFSALSFHYSFGIISSIYSFLINSSCICILCSPIAYIFIFIDFTDMNKTLPNSNGLGLTCLLPPVKFVIIQ